VQTHVSDGDLRLLGMESGRDVNKGGSAPGPIDFHLSHPPSTARPDHVITTPSYSAVSQAMGLQASRGKLAAGRDCCLASTT
jgi:hypothetical protein